MLKLPSFKFGTGPVSLVITARISYVVSFIGVTLNMLRVKEAAGLIKESKARLKAVENEFEEIKQELNSSETE